MSLYLTPVLQMSTEAMLLWCKVSYWSTTLQPK